MRIAFALALIFVLVDVKRAEACQCVPDRHVLVPKPGAMNVPLNPVLAVHLPSTSGGTVELRASATNELVPLVTEPVAPSASSGLHLTATPTAALSPNTQYTIVTTSAVASESSTFTTGDQRDDTPPVFAGLRAMSPEIMKYPITGCASSCIGKPASGHISRMRVSYEMPSDAVFATFELRRDGEDSLIARTPIEGELLGYSLCTLRAPALDADVAYCGRVVVYDAAGNRAGDDVEVCTATRRCEPMTTDDGCTPSDECKPASAGAGCDAGGGEASLMIALLFKLRRRRRHGDHE